MKAKILITSLLAICSSMAWAQSINYFVEGTPSQAPVKGLSITFCVGLDFGGRLKH